MDRRFITMFCWLTVAGLLALPASAGAPVVTALRQPADKLGFRVGALIQGKYWNDDPRYRATLGREFNLAISMVFMRNTQPEKGRFNFNGMDRDMRFAREHNLKLFGAALVYRNQHSPSWLRFMGPLCAGWRADALEQVLRDHIHTVVRYGGDAYWAWEVVNEPLQPAKNGCWSRVIGREAVIEKAFRFAREANPKALLVLNETFGREGVDREKTDEFFALIRRLKSAGAPIDVAGIQMHLRAHVLRPSYLEEFKYFLQEARKAGVNVHVTEMDVYQGPAGSSADPWKKQEEVYYNVLRTCLDDSNCTAFMVWGLHDESTWLKHRNDASLDLPDAKPLLFDDQFAGKPAYFGVLRALQKGR
jgi:endo-1,4-beta-xylanase